MSDLMEYKCPCCGGALEFNSTIQKMKCPYCDSEFEMDALKENDANLQNAQKGDDMTWSNEPGSEWEKGETSNMAVYVCKSCGGEIIGDKNTAATSCPFCDNPVVMAGNFSGDLKPDYVIPFKLDKKAAKEALSKHLEGKWLLPKVFSDENHIDEIKGIYVPYWLFDADINANIQYRGTKLRRWSDGEFEYVETSYYSLFRSGNVGFDNVPVDGSSKMPDDLMESLEPYDFSEAVDFQTAYLAGYLADRYDVSAEQSIERANERIKKTTEELFLETTSEFGGVTIESSSIELADGKTKYALLPVWLLNTTWEGTKYVFAMNGQTGKFVGDLPTDNKKYWMWLIIIAALIAVVVFGIATMLHC